MKLSFIAPLQAKLTTELTTTLQYLWEELVRAINFNDKFIDEVNLTNQSSLVNVNFNNVITPGLYQLSYYLVTTTTDGTAGTLRVDVAFTDDAGVVNVSTAAIALTTTARTSGVFIMRVVSNGINYLPILASGALNNARYALRMYLERLGD